jgi:hypothetical protein
MTPEKRLQAAPEGLDPGSCELGRRVYRWALKRRQGGGAEAECLPTRTGMGQLVTLGVTWVLPRQRHGQAKA